MQSDDTSCVSYCSTDASTASAYKKWKLVEWACTLGWNSLFWHRKCYQSKFLRWKETPFSCTRIVSAITTAQCCPCEIAAQMRKELWSSLGETVSHLSITVIAQQIVLEIVLVEMQYSFYYRCHSKNSKMKWFEIEDQRSISNRIICRSHSCELNIWKINWGRPQFIRFL